MDRTCHHSDERRCGEKEKNRIQKGMPLSLNSRPVAWCICYLLFEPMFQEKVACCERN